MKHFFNMTVLIQRYVCTAEEDDPLSVLLDGSTFHQCQCTPRYPESSSLFLGYWQEVLLLYPKQPIQWVDSGSTVA